MGAHRRTVAWILGVLLLAGCSGTIGEPPRADPAADSRSEAEQALAAAPAGVTEALADEPGIPAYRPATASTAATAEQTEAAGAFLAELSMAIAARDADRFMAHFTGDAAVSAWFWWQNMEALGMEAGASRLADTEYFGPVAAQNGSLVLAVELGSHLPGDRKDPSGAPYLVASDYVWTFRPAGVRGPAQVTDWVSRSRSPVDCWCLLKVVTSAAGILATYPDEVELGRRASQTLNGAQDWSRVFWTDFGTEPGMATAVVSFATDKQDRFVEWFQDPDQEALSENTIAAVFNQRQFLPSEEAGDGPERGLAGRMVILGAHPDPAVLVHELAHYVLTAQDLTSGLVPDRRYVQEGAANMVEATYVGTTLARAEAGDWKTDTTSGGQGTYLREVYAEEFAPAPPTDAQIDGDEGYFWYAMAASRYIFLVEEFGYRPAVAAAVCTHRTFADVFECVPDESTAAVDDVMADQPLEQAWRRWTEEHYG